MTTTTTEPTVVIDTTTPTTTTTTTVIFANKLIIKKGHTLSNAYLTIDTLTGKIQSYGYQRDFPTTQQQSSQSSQQSQQQILHQKLTCDMACAGFIDIHNHGLGGAPTVQEYWLSDHTLERLVRYGTTSVLASLIFSTKDDAKQVLKLVIQRLKSIFGQVRDKLCVVEGIHAEGPIIATNGGLPDAECDMSVDDFKLLVNEMMPALKVMTISPSLEKLVQYQRLQYLLDLGVKPALGHDTVADEDSILSSLRLAAKKQCQLHITHMYNVSAFHHRKQTLCNFGLASRFPKLPSYHGIEPPTVELIGDTVHVHPLTLQFTLDYKGNDVAMISDAIMDAHGGHVEYNDRQVEVCKKNEKNYAVLKGTNTIAGSCSNTLQIFHNLLCDLHVSVEKAVMMLSENPARIANLHHVGTLDIKKRGDVLLFDENYQLQHTVIAGRVAWSLST